MAHVYLDLQGLVSVAFISRRRYLNILESFNTKLALMAAQMQDALHKNEIKGAIERSIDNVIDAQGSYSVENIVETVKSQGYIIIPSVFSGQTLNLIAEEFHSIIAENKKFDVVDYHDGATCVRMHPFFRVKYLHDYPALFSFYNSSVLRAITKLFYSDAPKGYEHVAEIFVHETPETSSPLSGKLHWDCLQTLKYWVYIDDLSDEAGPMLIEPKSIERNNSTREKLLKSQDLLVGGKDNIVEVPEQGLVSLSGLAGSILIHDTDASHGASPVKPGYTRRIVRGHCRAII